MIKNYPLEVIIDNPYQTRTSYHTTAVEELAHSIKENGLLQVPPGRVDPNGSGGVELAFGHQRLRAFKKLAKEDKKFSEMPVDVKEMSNEDMAMFALEENMRRTGVTPLEVARAVDKYLTNFPAMSETKMAEKMKMTQGNISNMRRVLKLPDKVLEKVAEEKINFTMARELLCLVGIEGTFKRNNRYWSGKEEATAEEILVECLHGYYGNELPKTVAEIQKNVDNKCEAYFRPLDFTTDESNPLFDVKKQGCLKCESCIISHPTLKSSHHWCTKVACWDKLQTGTVEEARKKATEVMVKDVVSRVEEDVKKIEPISQEIPKKRGRPKKETPVIVVDHSDLSEEELKLKKNAEEMSAAGVKLPCGDCNNNCKCSRSFYHVGDDGETMVCESKVPNSQVVKADQKALIDIPEELRSAALDKAGTRAQVLDLRELRFGHYDEYRQGYHELITSEREDMDDPDECLKSCVNGFHYAFDSSRPESKDIHFVCTNGKCLGKKKAAKTRRKHHKGIELKKAESVAIKEAVKLTTDLDRSRMILIIMAQMEGRHCGGQSYYGSNSSVTDWFWKRVAPEVSAGKVYEHTRTNLLAKISALEEEDIAKLIVEFMLWSLSCSEEIERYKITTTHALNLMGVGVNVGGRPYHDKSERAAAEEAPTETAVAVTDECPECGTTMEQKRYRDELSDEMVSELKCPKCGYEEED